jgi:hypothetical protein
MKRRNQTEREFVFLYGLFFAVALVSLAIALFAKWITQ